MAKTIRDWVVVTERINKAAGGLQEYQAYLEDNKRSSHSNTEIHAITDNSVDFFSTTVRNAMTRDNNSKGGQKMKSYAQGFNFTLPQEFQPTVNEWKLIYLQVKEKLKQHLEIEDDNCFYANLHKEKKKHSHMNMMISKCENHHRIEKLDQRSTIVEAKKAFKQAVLDICKIHPSQYKKSDKPQRKRRLSSYGMKYKKQLETAHNQELLKKCGSFNEMILTNLQKAGLKPDFKDVQSVGLTLQIQREIMSENKNSKVFVNNTNTVDKLPKMR